MTDKFDPKKTRIDGEVGIHRRGGTYYLTFKRAGQDDFIAVCMDAGQWIQLILSLMESLSTNDIPSFASILQFKTAEMEAKQRAEADKAPTTKA